MQLNTHNQDELCGPQSLSDTLLKTAIATVKSGNNAVERNILFDEGTQRTFISGSLAAFGALTPIRRKLDVATLHIRTESSGYIPIQALAHCSENCRSIAELDKNRYSETPLPTES